MLILKPKVPESEAWSMDPPTCRKARLGVCILQPAGKRDLEYASSNLPESEVWSRYPPTCRKARLGVCILHPAGKRDLSMHPPTRPCFPAEPKLPAAGNPSSKRSQPYARSHTSLPHFCGSAAETTPVLYSPNAIIGSSFELLQGSFSRKHNIFRKVNGQSPAA